MVKQIQIFMIAFITFSGNGWAEDHIGRVIRLKGSINRVGMSHKGRLSEGDKVFEGDKIKSGSGSFIKVLMKDDSIFQIGPNSEFHFNKFKMRGEDKADRDAIYSIAKGQVRSLFTVKSKKKSLFLKTPTVSMGIRGTEIVTDVFNEGGKLTTNIALMSGKIDVDISKLNLKKKMMQMRPGELFSLQAPKGGQATAPPKVRDMPKVMIEQLRKPPNKGGKLFLDRGNMKASVNAPKRMIGPANANKDRQKLNKDAIRVTNPANLGLRKKPRRANNQPRLGNRPRIRDARRKAADTQLRNNLPPPPPPDDGTTTTTDGTNDGVSSGGMSTAN